MGLSLLTQAIAKPEGKTFKRRLSHFSCFYKEPLSWFVVRRIGKKKLKMKNGCGWLVTWGKDILSSFLGYIWFWITSREISRLQKLQTQLEIEAQICQLQPNCAFFFSFTGASACVHLARFDEAITWCDKGLAVSFPKVHEIISSKRLCSCHTPCKT